MNGPFSKLCIVPAAAAFLSLCASSGQALAPEGNCCFTVTSGSACGPLNQEDCENSGGTFLGPAPCPPPEQPCPDETATGACCACEVGQPTVKNCIDNITREDCLNNTEPCLRLIYFGDGTACGALPDEDNDGINDCFDECPQTGAGDPVDQEGCSCRQRPSVCNDGDPCTNDLCDPDSPFSDVFGCEHTEVDPDDGIDCTRDECDPSQGVMNTPVDGLCDDGNLCTDDTCDPGTGCRNTPIDCPEGQTCSGGECLEATTPGIVFADIAVKPGSCPSPINPASDGVLPVALFGTEEVDCLAFTSEPIMARRLDSAGEPVSPIRTTGCQDFGGPNDLSACAEGAEEYDLFQDGFADLGLFFPAPEAAEAWKLAQLPQGAKVALVISGPFVRDGNVTTDEHFVGFTTITKVGPQCSPCEVLQAGQCVSLCPKDQVCVVTNNFTGAVSTTSAEAFETTSGDIATGPGECLTPCTSVLDCFAVSKCEDCVDGFCRSRCPGKCDDTPQPCSECDGAGTCNLCCDESRICPPVANDCRFCCPEGDVCRDGQCLRPCNFDSDCADISNCEECRDGACVSKCVPPEVCIIGICMNPFQG